jgi:rhamnulokinase
VATTQDYLAIDLGASSGRSLIGRFDGRSIHLEETHRFNNRGLPVGDALYWDFLGLYAEILTSIRKSVKSTEITSLGIDTWGIDFGLLDRNDRIISSPRCYRDPRVNGLMDAAFQTVSKDRIFDQTGVQFLEMNTLYQLLSMVREGSPQLDVAQTFLTVPDLLNFLLTGVKVCEFSNTTTTQCYNPREGRWATELLDALSIPTSMFPSIVKPGTRLGPLQRTVAEETGAESLDVIAPACHDTGSAVAAVPMQSPDSLYISCGTWSLMGAEIQEPVITAASLEHNFTNEGGVSDTFRFLKNITGLWLVQECKRTWDLAGNVQDFSSLTDKARTSTPLVSFVDPDDAAFVPPGDMPSRLRNFCKRTGQTVPESEGAIIRCALESLALKSRYVYDQLQVVLGRAFNTIHIVGGGSQNTLLCQLTANATGCEVHAGPIEATAMGNILVQAMAQGEIGSLDEARQVVRNSTEIVSYTPTDQAAWNEAYGRFQRVLAK